ncbi:hypothetical protein [Bacillus sp. ISL-55]|uniref:hypothetical protein n=1 Tax=Bacillus sp. ISL-55 TaxID=2819134 RepID=UPI001BE6E959|nr:hypothetical protein [Bacillus sp. ISL-55]MBT2695427.1 hypothetical protein [Bacillus sp. ISL-55]
MNFVLMFLLEAGRILANLIRDLQKDDPVTMERNNLGWKFSIPKSIFLLLILMALLK